MQSFKSFKAELQEKAVRLTPAEFTKNNTKTGEPRADILIRLIQNGDPVELHTGKKVKIQNSPELIKLIKKWRDDDSEKKMPIPLLGQDGNAYTTSDLGKTAVFGGGKGAGGGTLNTKVTESHQCAMIQAMLENGIHEIDFYTDEIIAKAYKSIYVDATLDEVVKTNGDDKWKISSYYSAIPLIRDGYVNKGMTLHRGDKDMLLIYALKSEAFKNSGFPSLKDDKWNPGDIWAIKKGLNIKKALNTESVKSLNKSILELYINREMVGISLKLVTKENPVVKEFNVDTPPDTDDHKVMSIALESNRGSFWSAKYSRLFYDEGAIEFRDTSGYGAVNAEILGKNARGGRAGWAIMIDGMRQVFNKNFSTKFKSTIVASAKKIEKGDKKEIDAMWKMYNHFFKNETKAQFIKELSQKDGVWISSKLGGLFILYNIDIQSTAKQNRYITKIINYAGSKSEDSSSYVKVGK